MQPHDLPNTPIPPTWTSHGLYSLTTRPDIAIHRSVYAITPRLFPVQTNAQQLLDPVVNFDRSSKFSRVSQNPPNSPRSEQPPSKRPKPSTPNHPTRQSQSRTPQHPPYPILTPLPPPRHPPNDPLQTPFPSLTPLPLLSPTPNPTPHPIPASYPPPFLTALPTLTPCPAPAPVPLLTPLLTPHPPPATAPLPVLPPLAPPAATSSFPPSLTRPCDPLPVLAQPASPSTWRPPLEDHVGLSVRSGTALNVSRPRRDARLRSGGRGVRSGLVDGGSRRNGWTRIAPRESGEREGDEEGLGGVVGGGGGVHKGSIGTGNPLSVVRMGEEHFVVCAASGRLRSARVYNYCVTEDGYQTKQHVFRRGRRAWFDADTWRNGFVTDIVSSDWEVGSSEPCRAVFVTRGRLNFAHLCTDDSRPSVDWDETVLFPNAFSVALNPLYPAECAAISADGVFVGTPGEFSSKGKRRELRHCAQRGDEDGMFNRICYGQHPRSLLLASRTKLVSLDIRARVGKSHVIFDIRRHLTLPWYDRGISTFHLLNDRGYVAFVATQSCLNFVDLRMPSQPLLDWSISLPKPIDQSCVSSVRTGDTCSEVISLWSRRQCFLEVYHALHQQRVPAEKFELRNLEGYGAHRSGHVPLQPPPVGARSILWSDLPLSHLQQLKGRSRVSGMALLPLNEGRRMGLLQWSPTDGLIGQLLDIRPGDDTKEEFEAPPRDGYNAENAQRMYEFQRRLVDCGEYEGIDKIENPLKNGLPGSQIMRFVRQQSASDIAFARQFLVGDADDDVNTSRTGRFPRPYLGGMRKVQEMREASGDIGCGNEREMVGTTTKWGSVNAECGRGNGNSRSTREWEHSKGISSASTSAALGLSGRSIGGSEMISGTQSTDATQSMMGVAVGDKGGLPFLGSPEGSEKSSSSEESEMDELLDEIGFGRTLDQIAEFVRKGMRHNSTPFGVDGLRKTIESSGCVKWRDVQWREDCLEDHMQDRAVISTTKRMPDWVHTRVYYTSKVPSPERVCEELRVEKESELGQLVEELKDVILNEVED